MNKKFLSVFLAFAIAFSTSIVVFPLFAYSDSNFNRTISEPYQ